MSPPPTMGTTPHAFSAPGDPTKKPCCIKCGRPPEWWAHNPDAVLDRLYLGTAA